MDGLAVVIEYTKCLFGSGIAENSKVSYISSIPFLIDRQRINIWNYITASLLQIIRTHERIKFKTEFGLFCCKVVIRSSANIDYRF